MDEEHINELSDILGVNGKLKEDPKIKKMIFDYVGAVAEKNHALLSGKGALREYDTLIDNLYVELIKYLKKNIPRVDLDNLDREKFERKIGNLAYKIFMNRR